MNCWNCTSSIRLVSVFVGGNALSFLQSVQSLLNHPEELFVYFDNPFFLYTALIYSSNKTRAALRVLYQE